MHLLTADEMREMDRQTIESFGLPGRVLMENAGRGAARVLMKKYPDLSSKRVAIAAGRGNNGGDGFVIARYLAHAGIHVTVYLLSESSHLAGDAADNFNLLAPLNITVKEITSEENFNQVKSEMAHHHIWVDAILGTGLNSEVKSFFKSVINYINRLNRPVLSVDIPSGLHTDSGKPCGTCIRADITATFAFPKIGHILLPGAVYSGELYIIDIGIPPHIVENVPPQHHLISKDTIKQLIRPRACDIHKGGTGHVLVIAGSPGKTGAAVLTAMSALRTGAGLVTLGIPKSLNPIVESQAVEIMTVPLPETETGMHSDETIETILGLLEDKKCLALGPGMGTDTKTKQLVHFLIKECPVPMVIDADGLNNLAENPDILHSRKSEIILTPHPGEMARLVNTTPKDVQENRMAFAKEFATNYNVHLVLKGARTLTAHPDGHICINPTGNPGMASAGMGDVLTGMIAGFLSQGYSSRAATQLAVYLHGDAADKLAAQKGPYGYIASDIMDKLPEAIGGLFAQTAFQSPHVYRPLHMELL
ncbi:MAG: NAD(P)H-hydrate dehydratase [Desulfobacteraceae bacterium]|nr:NAD(P)H-hydrate dehydratase [Desulfobacteraceae bacterium]MBC2754942.1 NAD(P)H-hydrate dehydratase [Desulfobacteraceae bacterium]